MNRSNNSASEAPSVPTRVKLRRSDSSPSRVRNTWTFAPPSSRARPIMSTAPCTAPCTCCRSKMCRSASRRSRSSAAFSKSRAFAAALISASMAEMRAAANARDFEKAALLRDRLEALRHILERQQVQGAVQGAVDIIGLARDEGGANVQVFLTRDGLLSDRRSFTRVGTEGASEAELLERFMGESYSTAVSVPPAIVVPRTSSDLGNLALFLEGLRGTRVNVRLSLIHI